MSLQATFLIIWGLAKSVSCLLVNHQRVCPQYLQYVPYPVPMFPGTYSNYLTYSKGTGARTPVHLGPYLLCDIFPSVTYYVSYYNSTWSWGNVITKNLQCILWLLLHRYYNFEAWSIRKIWANKVQNTRRYPSAGRLAPQLRFIWLTMVLWSYISSARRFVFCLY